jgi:glycosyltransferase involved in cell wall biosynthesis/GT2 family glycosyltransferase
LGLPVSIVIPTYRRPASVIRLLRALGTQDPSSPVFEVIVALDGEDADLERALAEIAWPFPLQVVSVPHGGRAHAANAGIRRSRGEVVILLDDDMEPTGGLVSAHAAAHTGVEDRAVVGTVPIDTAGASHVVRYVGRKFERHLRLLARSGHAMTYREFYSGNFSARRATLVRVGLFDEAFREYGNEDGELALRLIDAGVHLVFSTAAAARQHYMKDFPGLALDTQSKGRTALLLARKWPDQAQALKLSTFDRGSRKWLTLRRLLLRAEASGWPITRSVLCWVSVHDRLHLPRLFLIYELVLDYCYWVGVRSAMRLGDEPLVRGDTHGQAAAVATVLYHVDAPSFGGAERVLLNLLDGLDQDRWRPALLLREDVPARMRYELAARHIDVHLLEPVPRGVRGLWRVVRMGRMLRRIGPAIVHLNQHEYRSGRHVALAAWLTRTRVISTTHLLPARKLRPDLGQSLMNRVVDHTIAVSPAIAERLVAELRLDPRRVQVILNGINERDDIQELDSETRRLLDTKPLVLAVGRLEPQKGFGDLVAVAALLPSIHIVIVGEGALRADLEDHAARLGVANRVHLLGQRDDLRAIMAEADIVAMPSRAEGLPLALLEAMAAGKPIVAADIPGIDVAMEDGKTGLLVPSGSVPAIADAIERLLGAPALAAAYGAEARRVASERFASKVMVAQVLAAYEDLLDRAPVPIHQGIGGAGERSRGGS